MSVFRYLPTPLNVPTSIKDLMVSIWGSWAVLAIVVIDGGKASDARVSRMQGASIREWNNSRCCTLVKLRTLTFFSISGKYHAQHFHIILRAEYS